MNSRLANALSHLALLAAAVVVLLGLVLSTAGIVALLWLGLTA